MPTGSQRTRRLAPDVRRRQLLDAALEVLSRDGFGAVTVEAVAQQGGVTRPVVYDTFGDLEGLMVALIDRAERTALGPLLAIVGGDPGDDADPETFLLESVTAFLEAVKSDPRTWRLVLMPPRGSSPELRRRIRRSRLLVAERVRALLDWGVPRRGGPLGLDHALAARLIVAAGEDAARLMLAHPRRFAPERLTALARDGLRLVPLGALPRGDAPPTVPPGPAPVAPPVAPAPGQRVPQAQRREQLLGVTLALLAEEGFDALSIEAIARRAGVNRTVVYRSFDNRHVLLAALLHREDRRIHRTLAALLPSDPGQRTPAGLLGDTLARFLGAVARQPQTWRVALLRPESAPIALQKLVNRRRAALARQLKPLVEWGLAGTGAATTALDVEVLARVLLCIGEELGRLLLDDPDYPVERLLTSSWALLDVLPATR
jgi:AcrR family transcriptional regulator